MERRTDSGFVEGEAMSEHDQSEDYDDELGKGQTSPDRLVERTALLMMVFALIQLALSIFANAVWLLPLLEKVNAKGALELLDMEDSAVLALIAAIAARKPRRVTD